MPEANDLHVGSEEYERQMDALMVDRLNKVHDEDPFVGGLVIDAHGVRPITERCRLRPRVTPRRGLAPSGSRPRWASMWITAKI